MRTQALVRSAMHRLGFDVERYPIHTTAQGHLKQALAVLESTVVLDVGANAGQFGMQLRTVCGFRGRIVSFEPAAAAFQRLCDASSADPLWEINQLALGSAEGEFALSTFSTDDWNSLHSINSENVGLGGRGLEPTGHVMCRVQRLDDVWERVIRSADRVFLKSDTQGHDTAVLAGAAERLASVDGVWVEASLHN